MGEKWTRDPTWPSRRRPDTEQRRRPENVTAENRTPRERGEEDYDYARPDINPRRIARKRVEGSLPRPWRRRTDDPAPKTLRTWRTQAREMAWVAHGAEYCCMACFRPLFVIGEAWIRKPMRKEKWASGFDLCEECAEVVLAFIRRLSIDPPFRDHWPPYPPKGREEKRRLRELEAEEEGEGVAAAERVRGNEEGG